MATLLNRRRYMGGGAPPVPETRLVCKYNVTSTSTNTRVIMSTENISEVEIDGVTQASVANSYRFTSTGEHTVKFTLKDNTSLAGQLFNGVAILSYLYIPASITSIGAQLLRGVTALDTVIVDENNPVYDTRDNCNAVVETSSDTIIAGCRSTVIPSSVIKIADYSFQSNGGITSITIPETITVLGNGTFRYCSNFTSITIFATTPPTIGGTTFGNTAISAIYVPSGSVETYQTDRYWSSYASIIQAITT